MSIHATNDRFKIKLDGDKYGFKEDAGSSETGIVVEVPKDLIYLSFHSFAFEESIANDEKLKKVYDYYNQFLGKRVFWEPLQASGRRMKEGDDEYVFLQMTDLLAYSDELETDAKIINELGSAGSYNLG